MKPSTAFAAAVQGLRNNRRWALLIAVGVIAGGAAVGSLVTIGGDLLPTSRYQNQVDQLANQINITAAKSTVGGTRNLTDSDVSALGDRSRAPHVAEMSAITTGTVAVTAGQANVKANLVGVPENYLRLSGREIAAGHWLGAADGDRGAVIGTGTVARLFGPNTDPAAGIGRPIQLGDGTFTVTGVFASNGQSDNVVAVPLASARAHLTGDTSGRVDTIIVKTTDRSTVNAALAEIATVLDGQHRIRSSADRDYNLNTFTASIENSRSFLYYLAVFIAAMVTISLLVGIGIGAGKIRFPRLRTAGPRQPRSA